MKRWLQSASEQLVVDLVVIVGSLLHASKGASALDGVSQASLGEVGCLCDSGLLFMWLSLSHAVFGFAWVGWCLWASSGSSCVFVWILAFVFRPV